MTNIIDALNNQIIGYCSNIEWENENTFALGIFQLNALRLINKDFKEYVDNDAIWGEIGKRLLLKNISKREELPKKISNLKDLFKKFPLQIKFNIFSVNPMAKCIPGIPSVVTHVEEFKNRFNKQNLNILWATLKKEYQINDVNLSLKVRAREFKDKAVTYKQKEEEFIEWTNKHPEVLDIEEIKICQEQKRQVGIPSNQEIGLPPAIRLFKKLKLIDLRGCPKLIDVPLKLRKFEKLEIVVDADKFGLIGEFFNKMGVPFVGSRTKEEGIPKAREHGSTSYCYRPEEASLYLNYPEENAEGSVLGKRQSENESESSPKKQRK